jgi:hypothetical protein
MQRVDFFLIPQIVHIRIQALVGGLTQRGSNQLNYCQVALNKHNIMVEYKYSLLSAGHLFPSVQYYDPVPSFSVLTGRYINVKIILYKTYQHTTPSYLQIPDSTFKIIVF